LASPLEAPVADSLTTEPAARPDERRSPPRWLITIYNEHAAGLCRFLRRKYGSGPPEPEDIMHEAFSRLAALPADVAEHVEYPKAFLYRTAENLLNTERRKRAVRIAHVAEISFTESGRSDCTPERVLLAKGQLDIAESVLRRMPERRRRCFLMHRFDELSFAEIGRRLGMTPNGAKGHVERAMAEIVRALEAAETKGDGA
jgi:RNA polymerase sigma factor (sigma-70 family)